MEETIFLEHNGIKVTNARFVTDTQTYAMSNITSIKPHVESPDRILPIIGFIIGSIIIYNEFFWVGFVIVALALLILYKQKTIYSVILKTSSGENQAFKTYNRDFLEKIISALNAAIVHRG